MCSFGCQFKYSVYHIAGGITVLLVGWLCTSGYYNQMLHTDMDRVSRVVGSTIIAGGYNRPHELVMKD